MVKPASPTSKKALAARAAVQKYGVVKSPLAELNAKVAAMQRYTEAKSPLTQFTEKLAAVQQFKSGATPLSQFNAQMAAVQKTLEPLKTLTTMQATLARFNQPPAALSMIDDLRKVTRSHPMAISATQLAIVQSATLASFGALPTKSQMLIEHFSGLKQFESAAKANQIRDHFAAMQPSIASIAIKAIGDTERAARIRVEALDIIADIISPESPADVASQTPGMTPKETVETIYKILGAIATTWATTYLVLDEEQNAKYLSLVCTLWLVGIGLMILALVEPDDD